MSNERHCLAMLLAAGSMAALAAPVAAQQAPGNAIEDRTRQQVRLPTEEEREEALLTGDTDIVLTRPTRLFTLHGDIDLLLSDNAFLTETDPVTDGSLQAQMGLGIGTRIGGTVDVFADASIVSVRYFDETALDYGALAGVIGVATEVGGVQLSATYQPVMVFNRDFEERQLTTHRLRLGAGLPFAVGAFLIQPSVFAERTLANPSDYDAWSGGGSVAVSTPLGPGLPIVAFGSIGYQRREFDAYFPGLVGTDRKDDQFSGGLGLAWRPNTWGEVRLSWTFQRNWSTSDVNRYQVHSGQFGLSARLRF